MTDCEDSRFWFYKDNHRFATSKNILKITGIKFATFNYSAYLCFMKAGSVNIESLQTVKNYAVKQGVTPSYIYKRVKERKMIVVAIDGVQFINMKEYPTIHSK